MAGIDGGRIDLVPALLSPPHLLKLNGQPDTFDSTRVHDPIEHLMDDRRSRGANLRHSASDTLSSAPRTSDSCLV